MEERVDVRLALTGQRGRLRLLAGLVRANRARAAGAEPVARDRRNAGAASSVISTPTSGSSRRRWASGVR
ncbi:hypothetical protein HBB16_00755 [Pseudonocardia sp. MCCB 268]|nr:hypothetical protein [Pseudonocardia cytotoxica]